MIETIVFKEEAKLAHLLAPLLGLGPWFDAAHGLATYENRYMEVQRLCRESRSLPEHVTKGKAGELGRKVRRTYRSLKYLSFDEEVTDYWPVDGDWHLRLPMEWWLQRQVVMNRVAMSRECLHVEVSRRGRPVYTLLLKDLRFSEYKWPRAGLPGEYTEYPFAPSWFRLCRGVPDQVICAAGPLQRPWIGPADRSAWYWHMKANGQEPSPYEDSYLRVVFSDGAWIGTVREGEEAWDVVVCDDDDGDRDVRFVDPRGFVAMRWDFVTFPDNARMKMMTVERYANFSSEPIAAEEFLPSAALLRETQSWRKLSEGEALAELKEVTGVDLSAQR